MHPEDFPHALLRLAADVRSSLAASDHRPAQDRVARPRLEILERRVNLSTYIWTALGDGQTWTDANNWEQLGPRAPYDSRPSRLPYSNVIFPPIATLPGESSTTIDFNFAYLYMPLNSLTIEDPYTFTGNPITIESSLSVANSFTSTPDATPATIALAGLELAPGVVISTATGSTLQLGNATAPTALQLTVQGAVTKSGGGQLVVDTQSVFYSNSSTVQPIPLTIAGGSIALGDTVNLAGFNVQINSTAGLLIADNVAAKVQALTGTGLVDLEGTTTAGDPTSLTVAVPNATTDQFGGLIDGIGQFIAGGNGTLVDRNHRLRRRGLDPGSRRHARRQRLDQRGHARGLGHRHPGRPGHVEFLGSGRLPGRLDLRRHPRRHQPRHSIHPACRHRYDLRRQPGLWHPGRLGRL